MTPNLDMESARRRRVCSPEEQREFARLGRLLLASGVPLQLIGDALGYQDLEGARHALDVAHVSPERLQRLRELATEKLGAGALQETPGAPPPPKVWTPPARLPGAGASSAADPSRGTVASGDAAAPPPASPAPQLDKAQQRRLRDRIDYLRTVNPRLRDGDLLARAAGLESADELEDEYHGGASPATLRNLEAFGRLQAAFGGRAAQAVAEGVPLAELRRHLMTQAQADTETTNGNRTEKDPDMLEAPVEALADEDSEEEAAEGNAPARRGARRGRRGRPRVHLTPAQHQQLRETMEALWARDERLRNWTLLARVSDLSTGPAAKRAYEVNSSVTTLKNLQSFLKLVERHGRAATDAVKKNVPVKEVEDYLKRSAPEARGPAAAARTGAQKGGAEPAAPADVEDAPAAVDFAGMLELGRTIDAELAHVSRAARLFDRAAQQRTLPGFVRRNAALARDHLRSAIALFVPDGEPTE